MKFLITVVFVISAQIALAQEEDPFFDKMDMFLKKFMIGGTVDYASVQKNPEQMNELYDLIGMMDLEGKSEDFRKAFHINVYNLLVIKQVTVFYPISSPFDVAGFFDNIQHNVSGEDLTLDDLEKAVIIKGYKDPRIHFVLVCAAKGCPPLLNTAYRPETIEVELEKKTKQMINLNGFVTVSDKEVMVSKIFKWYRSEFAENAGSLLAYLNRYREEKIPASATISFYEYDWTLNDFRN